MKRLLRVYGIMKIIVTIYCKLFSAREAGGKGTFTQISYSIMGKFMKQYVMIYNIKCFFVSQQRLQKQRVCSLLPFQYFPEG